MSKYAQWAQQAKDAGALDATTGGVYETPKGRAPGMRAVYDSPSSAGLLTSMRAGLSDDPNTRAGVYAGARFPDDPNASERYGIIDGDVVYSGDDGNLYREGAGVAGMGEAIGAGGPAFAGGTIGGLLGGPVGAGIGAAGAEGYKLAASNLMNDEPQTVGGNMVDMGVEAALNAGGWKLGDVIGNRLVSRRTARDISRYNLADARKLMNKSQNVGIELTGPEATGLRSLHWPTTLQCSS